MPVGVEGHRDGALLAIVVHSLDQQVQHLHHPREVQQRPAEAVDLVDDHAVDLPGLGVFEKPLEDRAFHISAGEPAIVVAIRQALPAFTPLAGDVVLTCLPLGVEAVELLLEALVGAFAGIDGTTDCGLAFVLPVRFPFLLKLKK